MTLVVYFQAVQKFMEGSGLEVFSPTTDLPDYYEKVNAEAMQDAVKKSKMIFAALSDGFFDSSWCKKEIEAAMKNGIKAIPIYSGNAHGADKVDKWIKEYKDDSAFKYMFKENARDVLNKQNNKAVKETLSKLAELAQQIKVDAEE